MKCHLSLKYQSNHQIKLLKRYSYCYIFLIFLIFFAYNAICENEKWWLTFTVIYLHGIRTWHITNSVLKTYKIIIDITFTTYLLRSHSFLSNFEYSRWKEFIRAYSVTGGCNIFMSYNLLKPTCSLHTWKYIRTSRISYEVQDKEPFQI